MPNVTSNLETRWALPMGNAVRALSVSEGVLVAGTDGDGTLVAIDMSNGRVLWRIHLPASIHNDAVIRDTIVIATFGTMPLATSPGGAWAFDLHTGRKLWEYNVSGALMPSAALVGDIAVLAAFDDCVYGVSILSGIRKYQRCVGVSSVMSNPKRVGDLVFFGTYEGRIVCLNGRSGAIQWVRRLPEVTHAGDETPASDGRHLYIAGTQWGGVRMVFQDKSVLTAVRLLLRAMIDQPWSERHRYFSRQYLFSIDQADGSVLWSARIGASSAVLRNQSGTPLLVGDTIVVSSPVGMTLSAFRKDDGKRLWQVALPSRHRGVPTFAGGSVFVGLESGELVAFRLSDGLSMGHCHWFGAFTPSAPLVVGRTFVYGAADGTLRAIPLAEIARALSTGGACARAA